MRGLIWGFAVLVLVGVPAFLLTRSPESAAAFDPGRLPGFDAFMEQTPVSQRAFIEDGIIEATERERAMASMVDCVRDAGYPTFSGTAYPDGSSTYGAPYTHGSWARYLVLEDVVEGCIQAHFHRVDSLYGWLRINPWRGEFDELTSQRVALCVTLQMPTSREGGYADWEDVMRQMGDSFRTTFASCRDLVTGTG